MGGEEGGETGQDVKSIKETNKWRNKFVQMAKRQRKNYKGKDKGVLNIEKMIKFNPSIRKHCRKMGWIVS